MWNRVAGLVVLGLVACQLATAQVIIKSSTKDDFVIAGNFTLSVVVESQSLVSQVEFYIDENLVSTDDSTPYEFQIDSLTRDDGPFVITVAAYSRSGESAKLNVRLKVDNGLALGVAHHIEVSEKFLTEQQWSKAIDAARIALKIEPNNNNARMAIARAYYGSGMFDRAQKFAEDVVASDPGHIAAHDLLSVVGLKQAFNAMQYGSGDQKSLDIIALALKTSAGNANGSFARRIANFGKVDDKNRLAYVDLLNEAGRYSLVIDELTPVFMKDERNQSVVDRMVYAMMRGGRYKEAQSSLRRHGKVAEMDAYGYALLAIVEDWFGNERESMVAEQEALLSDPSDKGVKTTQAFLALRRGNLRTAESVVGQLSNTDGFGAITNYYLTSLYFMQLNFEESQRAFQVALLGDPSMYHVYIERFNQAIAFYNSRKDLGEDMQFQLNFARCFAQGALEAKPESFEALTALALLSLYEKKTDEAIRFAQAAVAAGPQYPAAHYTLCAAYMEVRMIDKGLKALNDAGKFDVRKLQGMKAPNVDEAWRYFSIRGRTPLLAAPSG